MSIVEQIPGLFYDKGGATFNAMHPDFGATGDGVTDDTAAIQAALDFAVSATIGTEVTQGIVFLPLGDYLITQIVIPHGVGLIGSGSTVGLTEVGSKLVQAANQNQDMIRFTADASGFVHNVEISRLALFGDPTNISGDGISFLTAGGAGVIPGQNVRIRDIQIRGMADDGISVTRRGLPFYLRDIMFTNNGGAGIRFVPSEPISQIVKFENISGDNNADGLIVVDNTNGSGADVFIFDNIKAEKNVNGRQENQIVLTGMVGTSVIINGLSLAQSGGVTDPLSAVQLTGSQPKIITWAGIEVRNGTTPVIKDDVAVITIPENYKSGVYTPGAVANTHLIAGGIPTQLFYEVDGAVDEKIYDIRVTSGQFSFSTRDDDGTGGQQILSATRTGSVIDEVRVDGILVAPALGSISASSDALSVIDKNGIQVSTSAGDVIIGGLSGGVAGQIVNMFKITGANNLIIEHNEAAGDQKIITADGLDITLAGNGGVTMQFNGSLWFVISQ